MNAEPELHILLVTPLDYEKFTNNLEQYRVEHYGRMGCRVTVIYKTMNRSDGFWAMVRDTCSFRIRSREEGAARLIAVDPPFNYFAGYRRSTEDRAASSADFASPAAPSSSGRKFSFRLLIIRILSPLAALRDLFALPALVLAALLKVKGRPEVCVGFGPWGGLAGWILRKLGKVEMAVYQDRDYEPGLVPDRLRQAYTAAIERFTMRRSDLTFSIGHLLADLRRRDTTRPIHVVPSGVEWERFADARCAPQEGETLVYVGNVIAWSGLEHAIDALPRIRQSRPEARLAIVGDGLDSYMNNLRQRVQRLELGDCVQFHGRLSPQQLPGLLGRATIGLSNAEPVAFRRYACPLKVIEYMAAGLPVIATVGTEAARLIEQGPSGVTIPYDVDAFTEAAIALLSDPQRQKQLREGGIRQSAAMDWAALLGGELELIRQRLDQLKVDRPGGEH